MRLGGFLSMSPVFLPPRTKTAFKIAVSASLPRALPALPPSRFPEFPPAGTRRSARISPRRREAERWVRGRFSTRKGAFLHEGNFRVDEGHPELLCERSQDGQQRRASRARLPAHLHATKPALHRGFIIPFGKHVADLRHILFRFPALRIFFAFSTRSLAGGCTPFKG